MKISIITVVLNNCQTVEDTIKSVMNQTYEDVEHIVVDGGSTDGSIEIIKKYEKYLSKWISEIDSGMYDAMNKGAELADGDIIGFLNSDDIYFSDQVLEQVSRSMMESGSDCCYGDIVYMSADLSRIIRYWKAGDVENNSFRKGWMPPHPGFFIKKNVFLNAGSFRADFQISADYELMLRLFLKDEISSTYIPECLVKMRVGGKSNSGVNNLIRKSCEDLKAWKVNGLKISPFIIVKKPLSKIFQFSKIRRIEC